MFPDPDDSFRTESLRSIRKIVGSTRGSGDLNSELRKHLAQFAGMFGDIVAMVEADRQLTDLDLAPASRSWITQITEGEYNVLALLQNASMNGVPEMSGSDLMKRFNERRLIPMPSPAFFVFMERIEQFGFVSRFYKDKKILGQDLKIPWFTLTGSGRQILQETDALLADAKARQGSVAWATPKLSY